MVTLKLYGTLAHTQNIIPYIDKQFMRYLRYGNNNKNTVHNTTM